MNRCPAEHMGAPAAAVGVLQAGSCLSWGATDKLDRGSVETACRVEELTPVWPSVHNDMQSSWSKRILFEYISKDWELGSKPSFRLYEDISIKLATRTKNMVEEEGNSRRIKFLKY